MLSSLATPNAFCAIAWAAAVCAYLAQASSAGALVAIVPRCACTRQRYSPRLLHDSQRDWRTGKRLEDEGFKSFRSKFGDEAFALHHRFYLHLDRGNRLWLSAEDGCEGVAPAL